MEIANDILKKLKIKPDTCVFRAVQMTREYLDSQPSPRDAANSIIKKVGIPPVDNVKKSYVFAMTTVEQSLTTGNPNIDFIIAKSNERIEKITDMLGTGAFTDYTGTNATTTSSDRKGGKRKIAEEIYLSNRDKSDKEVIALIQQELEVTKQNAYTYLYVVKKNLNTK